MSKHLDHLAHLKTMVETYRLSGGSTTLLLCDGSERLQVYTDLLVSALCNVIFKVIRPLSHWKLISKFMLISSFRKFLV